MQDLADELGSAGSIAPAVTRDRILDLFGKVDDERDRIVLLELFSAITGITARHLEATGQDTNGILAAITADKRILAIQEAQIDGEAGQLIIDQYAGGHCAKDL